MKWKPSRVLYNFIEKTFQACIMIHDSAMPKLIKTKFTLKYGSTKILLLQKKNRRFVEQGGNFCLGKIKVVNLVGKIGKYNVSGNFA